VPVTVQGARQITAEPPVVTTAPVAPWTVSSARRVLLATGDQVAPFQWTIVQKSPTNRSASGTRTRGKRARPPRL
jgi:hypothetical protein